MSKFEDLTTKIQIKVLLELRLKGNCLGKAGNSLMRASSDPSSASESELEEQVRQRKKKKTTINSPRLI